MHFSRITAALTGPPPTNVDFNKDTIGGSASNAWFAINSFAGKLVRSPKLIDHAKDCLLLPFEYDRSIDFVAKFPPVPASIVQTLLERRDHCVRRTSFANEVFDVNNLVKPSRSLRAANLALSIRVLHSRKHSADD
jgi:hypothetical protein